MTERRAIYSDGGRLYLIRVNRCDDVCPLAQSTGCSLEYRLTIDSATHSPKQKRRRYRRRSVCIAMHIDQPIFAGGGLTRSDASGVGNLITIQFVTYPRVQRGALIRRKSKRFDSIIFDEAAA